MNKTDKFNKTYINVANNIAQLSHAVRYKVGAIIVDRNDNIISYGFNGTPSGFDNNCEYTDIDGNLKTKDEVLHAESNAIAKLAKNNNGSSNNAKMYISLSPCYDCAKLIIQSGITEVYYETEYRDVSGIELLKKSGIKVKQVK